MNSFNFFRFFSWIIPILLFSACRLTGFEPISTATPESTATIIPPTLPPCQQVTLPVPTIPVPTSTLIPTLPVELRGTVNDWPASTPEEQGMDSAMLTALFQALQNDPRRIHSLLIERHGTLVVEAYFEPFNRGVPHNTYSCTKSVTSAAVGITMGDGLLPGGVNTPVWTLFPGLEPVDEGRKAITLQHLLTMSSGLEWSEPVRSGLSDNWAIHDSDSPPDYFFSRAAAAVPGQVFNYNSGGSHLLSMTVENTTGLKTAEFVEEKIFRPLGIDRYVWLEDASHHTLGGSGLALAPPDMLRFGRLYMQRGMWGADQVIPESWVDESTARYFDTGSGAGYGYQWWIHPSGVYSALGWGGQQIIIAPQQDMTIVFTAGIRDAAWNTYEDLLNTYILPTARSYSALPPNPAGNISLQENIRKVNRSEIQVPASLPAKAREISGKTYVDLNGTHGWSTFTFHFPSDRLEYATLDLMYGDKSEEFTAHIGLDGTFRDIETLNYGPLAMKGYWKDDSTFVLTQQFLREAEEITMEMTFEGDIVKRSSRWLVEDHTEESDAVLLN